MDEQVLRNILKFTKRLKKDPYTKLYAPLADGYRQVGLLEDSIDKCVVGLELYPRYLACREVLGKIYLRQNKPAEALTELEAVHEVIGDNLQLCKSLVKVYAKADQADKALAMLDWIIVKDPFDFEMRNIATQLRRDQDHQQAREDAIAAGQDPDAIDIFELAEREAVIDIRRIVDAEPDIDYDREAHQRATDDALDSLENIEEAIDAQADRIVADAAADPDAAADKAKRTSRDYKLRNDNIEESVAELSGAALIAQVEIELSLLDEASLLCERMLKKLDDDDLRELAEKFAHRIVAKETELEELERKNLAHGL